MHIVQWAGLTVQAGGARPDEKRIEAVSRFPVPTNKASLRSWIALVNQLGYHVPGLSAKTRLQRELLKKEVAFLWTEEHNKEFLAIREEQGGRTWQAFGGGKNGHETFRQARIYNFRDKCVVFARNLKFSNLTQ